MSVTNLLIDLEDSSSVKSATSQKSAEKQAVKAAKAWERELTKLAKAQEKEAKAAAKAQEKEAKAQEKAAKAAAKAQEKAAKAAAAGPKRAPGRPKKEVATPLLVTDHNELLAARAEIASLQKQLDAIRAVLLVSA